MGNAAVAAGLFGAAGEAGDAGLEAGAGAGLPGVGLAERSGGWAGPVSDCDAVVAPGAVGTCELAAGACVGTVGALDAVAVGLGTLGAGVSLAGVSVALVVGALDADVVPGAVGRRVGPSAWVLAPPVGASVGVAEELGVGSAEVGTCVADAGEVGVADDRGVGVDVRVGVGLAAVGVSVVVGVADPPGT